ncbi:MAG: aldose 1-epimerase [Planctomycetaceae bacterium]|nr:aldose 1-epimerase [Planctomycetaceae bacterium]
MRSNSLVRLFLFMVVCTMSSVFGSEPSVNASTDPETGGKIVTATCGKTTIKIAPDFGCNLFSIVHDGTELLGQAPSTKEIAGFHYGNPILYPSPNRVRDSKFEFGGKEFQFTPNDGKNFLHGIVHSAKWESGSEASTKTDDSITVHFQLKFEPGTEHYKLFPFKHVLRYDVTVKDGAVKCSYTVDNRSGTESIPFGFALHPWFLYQGKRSETFLTVPAANHMDLDESRPGELLPSGKLSGVVGSLFDCLAGRSLADWVVDDVWYGMTADKPARIEFRDKQISIELVATGDFTHLVVYTPADQPWFCVENQTCSTDAHNLHSKGIGDPAHLQIVPKGGSKQGSVEYRITKK